MNSRSPLRARGVARACVLLLLGALPWLCLPALAQERQEEPVAQNCPLQTVRHRAEILTQELRLAPGEDGFVDMTITPEPGNDFYVSALAKVLHKPAGARTEILPGFPRLRFRADTAGEYRLQLRVTLVSKSSCGGVKARELAQGEVLVLVR